MHVKGCQLLITGLQSDLLVRAICDLAQKKPEPTWLEALSTKPHLWELAQAAPACEEKKKKREREERKNLLPDWQLK